MLRGCIDFDYAIKKDEPPVITDNSTQGEIALYERWEWHNYLSMMYIKTRIFASIRGLIPDCAHVKDLLKVIDQFESSNKALASTLMTKLLSIKLTSVKGVWEHIMRIRDLAAQLKA